MDETPTNALRAMAHPLRLQILSLLTGAELSAAEVARELDLTHANASYHLRVLLEAGELEVASEERIRGGVAKRYRHPWQQGLTAQRPTPDQESSALYIRALAEEMVRRYRVRMRDTRANFTDAELWVTPEIWDQVHRLVEQASSLLHDQAQPRRTPGTVRVSMTSATFRMADQPGVAGQDR